MNKLILAVLLVLSLSGFSYSSIYVINVDYPDNKLRLEVFESDKRIYIIERWRGSDIVIGWCNIRSRQADNTSLKALFPSEDALLAIELYEHRSSIIANEGQIITLHISERNVAYDYYVSSTLNLEGNLWLLALLDFIVNSECSSSGVRSVRDQLSRNLEGLYINNI